MTRQAEPLIGALLATGQGGVHRVSEIISRTRPTAACWRVDRPAANAVVGPVRIKPESRALQAAGSPEPC